MVPGGNLVLSYLDVACADATQTDAIAKILEDASAKLVDTPDPFDKNFDDIAVRYGYQYGIPRESASKEFKELADAIVDILKNRPPKGNITRLPLKAFLQRTDEQETYSLDAESQTRVAAKHAGRWNPRRAIISHETRMDFDRDWGSVIPHIVYMLTDLSINEVKLMGGMVLYDEETKSELANWSLAEPEE